MAATTQAIIVTALRSKLSMSHLREFIIKVTLAVAQDDTLEEFRRRNSWRAACGYEFAWARYEYIEQNKDSQENVPWPLAYPYTSA